MINRRRPSPAPPFPSPPRGWGRGADGCSAGISAVGGQAGQAGSFRKKLAALALGHWCLEPGILRAPGSHPLPLHRNMCICFTLSPGRSP